MPLFHVDDDRFVPTGLTRGPWDPNAQNGGAVAALVARVAERHDDAAAPLLERQQIARLTLDLVRPVPLSPLSVSVNVVRPGKKLQLLEVLVRSGEDVMTRGLVVRLLAQHDAVGRTVEAIAPRPPDEIPENHRVPLALQDMEYFHADALDVRVGPKPAPGHGPMEIWARLQVPVVDDEPPTPSECAAAVADFASGVTSVAPPRYRSLNTDINLHMFRLPESDWLCYWAQSFADRGIGFAEGGLYDLNGRFGRSTQTVIVEPWKRPGD